MNQIKLMIKDEHPQHYRKKAEGKPTPYLNTNKHKTANKHNYRFRATGRKISSAISKKGAKKPT